MGVGWRNLRYRPSIFILSEDMSHWLKDVSRKLLSGELINLELVTPFER